MASLYTNVDGLTQSYGGSRIPSEGYTRKYVTYGARNEVVIDFDYSTLEVYDEGEPQSSVMDRFSELMAYMPEGAGILSAHIVPIEDFDEDINVGVYQKDGTVIDADGLVAASTPTVAGGVVEGAGAVIGDVTTMDNYIVIEAAVGAPTTGKARLVVTYMK